MEDGERRMEDGGGNIMAKSKHDQIAEKLAKKFGTEYKKHKGIDIVTNDRVIEVEVTNNVKNFLPFTEQIKK